MTGTQAVRPTLMLVTDRRRAGRSVLGIVDSAVDGGVDVVQIRENDLAPGELLAFARQIVSVVGERASVVVNTDVAVALELGMGLHLPEAAPMLSDRQVERLGPNTLLGRSAHSADAIAEERVDYLLFGHIFATNSKPDLRPRGLDALTEIVARYETPVWAIGGITAHNVAAAIERGARGIAVIGAILDAPDTREATIALRSEIDRAAGLRSQESRKTE